MRLIFNFKIIFLLFIAINSYANNDLSSNDPRYASLNCQPVKDKSQISCDYRFSGSLEVGSIGARIGQKPIQISKELISAYPAQDQSTALLFLVDSSDPNRKNTVEKKVVGDIFEIFSGFGSPRKPHLKIGLAIFDSNINVISPIGSEDQDSLNALSKIKAEGQATEFYKSILEAINLLSKTDATRKALIIFSDGKDEDRAYKKEDVIREAKKNNVVILGIGYAEKLSDVPYLQTLKRLSEETYGLYIDANDRKSFGIFLKNPLSFIEQGGRFFLDSSGFYGNQKVTVDLVLQNEQKIEITSAVDVPDLRPLGQKLLDLITNYWAYILIGTAILVVMIYFINLQVKKSKKLKTIVHEYAYLTEPDGTKTQHVINKTAIRIGRSSNNDIVLLNDSISSHHAEIHRRRDGTFYIVDLGSTNGVYINSKKITQSEISDGDKLELGEVHLQFLLN
jgi:hypothetical protein